MVEHWRKPNAFKHGIFLKSATVLPGEDRREYGQLVDELIEEWKPDGAAEYEAVLTMADARWRKLRAQTYRHIQFWRNRIDVNHPSYDEHLGLKHFLAAVAGSPEDFDLAAAAFLHPKQIDRLKRKCPRQNFGNNKEWVLAMFSEMKEELEPPLPQMSKKMLADFKGFQAEMESFRIINRAADTFTDKVFERELAIDERLDATFDRAFKRLIQIKAAKQALGLARPAAVVDQPTKNLAAKISERVKRSARRPSNR